MNRRLPRRGFALAMVLVLTIGLLVFVSVLFFRSRAQRDTFGQLELQAKALAAARGIMQMALYKFRVLPTEFYQVASAVRELPPAQAAPYTSIWLAEMDSERDGPIARRLTDALKLHDGRTYRVGINRFELITREDTGYRRDFIKIEAWGQCETEKKIIEELLEVEVTHD
ncbi:MAG: hypothetical protein OZSIB_3304 [Candidatus Ozemobacter sibiricus]|uniref:Uncharacterized protein n=1 Tax=Candidatus Ozemobacter sibiricus TaxID=2268124 RepID=A0A367ZH45_9BACT|nr:MAG: hypothetical protein OZSIB_3304 [Candidatus Ozemobacter sibiricus]